MPQPDESTLENLQAPDQPVGPNEDLLPSAGVETVALDQPVGPHRLSAADQPVGPHGI
jgi:hypothetical protein